MDRRFTALVKMEFDRDTTRIWIAATGRLEPFSRNWPAAGFGASHPSHSDACTRSRRSAVEIGGNPECRGQFATVLRPPSWCLSMAGDWVSTARCLHLQDQGPVSVSKLTPHTRAANVTVGSSPAACPPRDERPESARKPGVRGGWGELRSRVVNGLWPGLLSVQQSP